MLARMLVGSIVPTAGNVRLDMMDLRNWDPRQFGESVGYLPQEVQLFPATIKANIARMRADAVDEDIFDAAETADVHQMISEMAQGYETLDASGERALAKALLRAKEKRMTVVTITQRPALLQSVDKIMILANGSVQAFGARDEVIPLVTGRKQKNASAAPMLEA